MEANVNKSNKGKSLFDKVIRVIWMVIALLFTFIVFREINTLFYDTLKLTSEYWSFITVPVSIVIGLGLDYVLRNAFD